MPTIKEASYGNDFQQDAGPVKASQYPTHLRAERPILPLLPPGDLLVEKEDFGLVEVPRPEFRPHDP